MRTPVMLVGKALGPTEEHIEAKEERGEPVPVELQYIGVGELHQGWFGHAPIVSKLATDLGRCMHDRAIVRMTWDEEVRIGNIWLLLDGRQLDCHPGSADPLDLTVITPLAEALATYRDQVAGRFDLRVSTFRAGIEVLKGTHVCRIRLGGQYPPDGSSFDACVDLGGKVRCAGDKSAGHTTFAYPNPKDSAYLRACLR